MSAFEVAVFQEEQGPSGDNSGEGHLMFVTAVLGATSDDLQRLIKEYENGIPNHSDKSRREESVSRADATIMWKQQLKTVPPCENLTSLVTIKSFEDSLNGLR